MKNKTKDICIIALTIMVLALSFCLWESIFMNNRIYKWYEESNKNCARVVESMEDSEIETETDNSNTYWN